MALVGGRRVQTLGIEAIDDLLQGSVRSLGNQVGCDERRPAQQRCQEDQMSHSAVLWTIFPSTTVSTDLIFLISTSGTEK